MLRLAPGSWLTTTDARLGVTVLPHLQGILGHVHQDCGFCSKCEKLPRKSCVSCHRCTLLFLENLRAQQGEDPSTHAGFSGVGAENGEPTWETLPFFMAACSGVVVESFLPFS